MRACSSPSSQPASHLQATPNQLLVPPSNPRGQATVKSKDDPAQRLPVSLDWVRFHLTRPWVGMSATCRVVGFLLDISRSCVWLVPNPSHPSVLLQNQKPLFGFGLGRARARDALFV